MTVLPYREHISPPLHLQGRGTARSAVEGTLLQKDPSTMLRMVPLPRKSGGGKEETYV
jgi:hypothetical protein